MNNLKGSIIQILNYRKRISYIIKSNLMLAERKHVYLFIKLVYRKAFLEKLPIFLNPSIEITFCLFC